MPAGCILSHPCEPLRAILAILCGLRPPLSLARMARSYRWFFLAFHQSLTPSNTLSMTA